MAHAHGHVDVHVVDTHHHHGDHHEIYRLQCEAEALCKDRTALKIANSKSAADIAELQRIEAELKIKMDQLLEETKRKELDANATQKELQESISSLNALLRTRENELDKETRNKEELKRNKEALEKKEAELRAENNQAYAHIDNLAGEKNVLTSELGAVKNKLELTECEKESKARELERSTNEICRLQGEAEQLCKDRTVLKLLHEQTEEDVAKLRSIEEELREKMANLLAEIKLKERDAEATAGELKQSLNAVTDLLRTREEELEKEAFEKERLAEEKLALENLTAAERAEKERLIAEKNRIEDDKARLATEAHCLKTDLAIKEHDIITKANQLHHSNAEVARLQIETDRLYKSRASLARQNTRTVEDIAEMKKVEEGLRVNVQNLLAQISETEENGNATAEELRATLASTSQLLRNREQELADEIAARSKASAAAQKAERSNDILKSEIES